MAHFLDKSAARTRLLWSNQADEKCIRQACLLLGPQQLVLLYSVLPTTIIDVWEPANVVRNLEHMG
jgi:hypothetical protein